LPGKEIWMNHRLGRPLALALLLAMVGACAQEPEPTEETASSPTASSDSSPTSTVQDIMEIGGFSPLDPGTYAIDPDLDPDTPLRVEYEVPAGWSQWIGAAKFSDAGHVGVSITSVSNLVSHGCRDHSWADPPVGPSVDALAEALADLAPFRVTSPPRDVSVDGFSGTYLELTVPKLPFEGEGDDGRFTRCIGGQLKSWVAAIDTEPDDAFYGYTGPGLVEEFWIVDVEGTRLMIAAERSPGSPSGDVEEQGEILHSIRIEP
jgi:hypothetical protein